MYSIVKLTILQRSSLNGNIENRNRQLHCVCTNIIFSLMFYLIDKAKIFVFYHWNFDLSEEVSLLFILGLMLVFDFYTLERRVSSSKSFSILSVFIESPSIAGTEQSQPFSPWKKPFFADSSFLLSDSYLLKPENRGYSYYISSLDTSNYKFTKRK